MKIAYSSLACPAWTIEATTPNEIWRRLRDASIPSGAWTPLY